MQQLANFSIYSIHTRLFNDDWNALAAFVAQMGLDGIELLIHDQELPELPPDLAVGVHLPYWIRWLDIWRDGMQASVTPEDRCYLAGDARDAADMVAKQHAIWSRAAALNPRYAVFHVSHVTMEHAFTREYDYTTDEVIDATVELLNATAATFPGGEPPVRLWLENLWWPGLHFNDPAPATMLAERLHFDNWAFVLDTGHAINTAHRIVDEDAAIDLVLEQLAGLDPALRRRIEGIHLNLSLSGAYQRETIAAGLPEGFSALSFSDQYVIARGHVGRIDQHRPFCSPRCREIVAAVDPQVVIHEFVISDLPDLRNRLATQIGALRAGDRGQGSAIRDRVADGLLPGS
jgi:sugar phosphate isomerase/epimerase